MWKDLAALVPPLTVAAVFLAGVFWVVRREMGGKRRREDAPEKRKAGR
jgi:negative regulator of sigma E activity